MDEIQYHRELEQIFVNDRAFGDSDYILRQVDICYDRRLSELSAYLPVAGTLRDALTQASAHERRCALGDPTMRFAINSALREMSGVAPPCLPREECEGVFRASTERLQAKDHRAFGSGSSSTINEASCALRVWSGECAAEAFSNAFPHIVKERFAHKCQPGAELAVPSAADLDMLRKGVLLLDQLVPDLARSALRHVNIIALFPLAPWKGAASMSQFGLSGAIFLSQDLLGNPWWVAEHLIHEALHQKLYDFRHGHSLLASGYSREEAPRVRSLWNIPGDNAANSWDVHRAVAAFHVYVHLALVSALAEERVTELEDIFGPLRGMKSTMTNSRKALERAQYLGEQLTLKCHDELGLAGQKLVAWLTELLAALDPAPAPAGSTLHLLLDRYRGEARSVQSKIRSDSSAVSKLGPQLACLAKREVASLRAVIKEANAKGEKDHFENALKHFVEDDFGRKFAELRGLICNTILRMSTDGYSLNLPSMESVCAESQVTTMIEESSKDLHRILVQSMV
jgi:hypothetical protein